MTIFARPALTVVYVVESRPETMDGEPEVWEVSSIHETSEGAWKKVEEMERYSASVREQAAEGASKTTEARRVFRVLEDVVHS